MSLAGLEVAGLQLTVCECLISSPLLQEARGRPPLVICAGAVEQDSLLSSLFTILAFFSPHLASPFPGVVELSL